MLQHYSLEYAHEVVYELGNIALAPGLANSNSKFSPTTKLDMIQDCHVTQHVAGKHEDTLSAPDQVLELYSDVVDDEGNFPMPYGEIVNGGAYCVEKGSTAPTVLIGGMFFWDAGGECVAPPVNDEGESCCEVFMWQPNTAGLYYENCSMKCVTVHSIFLYPFVCLSRVLKRYQLLGTILLCSLFASCCSGKNTSQARMFVTKNCLLQSRFWAPKLQAKTASKFGIPLTTQSAGLGQVLTGFMQSPRVLLRLSFTGILSDRKQQL